jgi:curli biogenesis system outer membrane secretion channel CsgG
MRTFTAIAFALMMASSVFAQGTPVVSSSRPTVAVKDFDFGTIQKWWEGDLNVGKGVSDMLVDELLATGGLRILERAQLDAVLQEQDLAKSGRTMAGGDAQTGKVISARYFVTGSVTKFGGETRSTGIGALGGAIGAFTGQAYLGMFDLKKTKGQVEISLRVIDTTSGEIVAAVRSFGESKRKGLLVGGAGITKGGKIAGSSVEIGSSNFRETLLGEATSAAVHDAACKLAAAIGAR